MQYEKMCWMIFRVIRARFYELKQTWSLCYELIRIILKLIIGQCHDSAVRFNTNRIKDHQENASLCQKLWWPYGDLSICHTLYFFLRRQEPQTKLTKEEAEGWTFCNFCSHILSNVKFPIQILKVNLPMLMRYY